MQRKGKERKGSQGQWQKDGHRQRQGYHEVRMENNLNNNKPVGASLVTPVLTRMVPSQVTDHTLPERPIPTVVTSLSGGVGMCCQLQPSGQVPSTPLRTITCS